MYAHRERERVFHSSSAECMLFQVSTSKEWWLSSGRGAKRSYFMFKVRNGGCEEIPLFQGKEQQLRFTGTAVKRYPTTKVRETQVRQ